jgi:hypothetical protein
MIIDVLDLFNICCFLESKVCRWTYGKWSWESNLALNVIWLDVWQKQLCVSTGPKVLFGQIRQFFCITKPE